MHHLQQMLKERLILRCLSEGFGGRERWRRTVTAQMPLHEALCPTSQSTSASIGKRSETMAYLSDCN